MELFPEQTESQEDALFPIPIALFGIGGVGRALLQHILRTNSSLATPTRPRVVVHAVVDSQHSLCQWQPGGLTDDELRAIVGAKEARQALPSASVLGAMLQPHGGSPAPFPSPPAMGPLVYVDCTSSDALGRSLLHHITLHPHCCLVLANKKPVTASMAEYDALVGVGWRVRYEATCGAGLPVVGTLERMVGAGDEITRIAGALSGTLGYVLAGLEEGRLLSAVVLAAKAEGFTEPDPRDDLAGTDVARKALILARKLGARLDLADVAVESLFPPALGPDRMALSDFLTTGLASLDESMARRCDDARREGKVLRYAATVEGGRCRVGLLAVAPDSPLGRLKGADNLVAIHSRCYLESPLVIQGAGAGNDTTATGVLADILDLHTQVVGIKRSTRHAGSASQQVTTTTGMLGG